MAVQISHTFKRTPTGAGIYYGWFEAMHSRFDLLAIGIEEDLGEALCHKVAEETLRLEKRLNRFDEESDIWQLNHLDNYDRYAADPELIAIFSEALRYREMTAGAFDIAVQTPDYRIETPCFAVDASCESIIKTRPDAIADFGGFGPGILPLSSLIPCDPKENSRQCAIRKEGAWQEKEPLNQTWKARKQD